jgi:hypothetical protein
LQHIKIPKLGNTRLRRRRRLGADAAFAKAMARAEFGRFYTDECEQREVRRSLERAKARRKAEKGGSAAAQVAEPAVAKPADKGSAKPKLWHRPSVRERRTEIAEGMARLIAGAKRRKAEDSGA